MARLFLCDDFNGFSRYLKFLGKSEQVEASTTSIHASSVAAIFTKLRLCDDWCAEVLQGMKNNQDVQDENLQSYRLPQFNNCLSKVP